MKPGSQKPQDDRSHCWSFGSTNHPSSQSRKISVGVLVDSLPKKAFEASKEHDIEGNDGERLKSAIVRSSSNGKGVINKVNSPWVSPKRIYEHGTTSEAVLCADVAGSGRSKLDGVNNARSVLPSDDDRLKRFNGATYERKQKKERLTQRAQDFTFATTPNPDIETTKNSTEPGTTVGLRLRLQQILGAVSSPNDHHSESPTPELGGNPEHKSNQMGGTGGKPSLGSDKEEQKSDGLLEPTLGSNKRKQKLGSRVFKPRQNSDTIETDSDCPDSGRVNRPMTRSSTRRRPPTKIIKKTAKNDKVKHQEKKISSHATTGGNSPMFTGKKYERKSFKVKPLHLFKEKIQQASVTPPPTKKTSTFGTDHSSSHLTDREIDCGQKSIPNDNPMNARVTDEEDNPDKPFDSPEKRDQEENIGAPSENMGSPSVRRFVDVLPSPTFRVNAPASSSSLSPTPKTPIEEIREQDKTPECYSDEQLESSDDDSQTRKASPAIKQSEMEESSDDNSSESSKEYSPSTDDFDAKKMDFMHRLPNKICNKKQTKTLSPSIKGTREGKWIPNTSEHNKGDGLSRALELFASELEKLRNKIKSASSKRSSEILKSVVADVHLQLQNAETHVQTDMGKLKNLSKLKRKRVETKFEEQEVRLQMIHAKFKEQINQHLQDCKSSFEGLEAEQKEFKGTLEKRKSSHRKLVLQVEECVEVQLIEAQKKITATHEAARKRMAQLKQVLGSCLKDNILS